MGLQAVLFGTQIEKQWRLILCNRGCAEMQDVPFGGNGLFRVHVGSRERMARGDPQHLPWVDLLVVTGCLLALRRCDGAAVMTTAVRGALQRKKQKWP